MNKEEKRDEVYKECSYEYGDMIQGYKRLEKKRK